MNTAPAVVLLAPLAEDAAHVRDEMVAPLTDLLITRQPDLPWSVTQIEHIDSVTVANSHLIIICTAATDSQAPLPSLIETGLAAQPSSTLVIASTEGCASATSHACGRGVTLIDRDALVADHPSSSLVVVERMVRHIIGDDYLPRLADPNNPADSNTNNDQPSEVWLCTGDAVTAHTGADTHLSANGFVSLLHELVLARYPKRSIQLINTGVAEQTIADLATRWEQDCLAHQPQRVLVTIGVDDCRRFVDANDQACAPEAFAATYRALLDLTRERLGDIEIVLLSPFWVGSDGDNDHANESSLAVAIEDYLDAVRTLADDFDCRFINLHGRFRGHRQYRPSSDLAVDHRQPTSTGCAIIGEAIFDTVIGDG